GSSTSSSWSSTVPPRVSIPHSSSVNASQATAAALIILGARPYGTQGSAPNNLVVARCGESTALGSPVLPDVQNSVATSSGATSGKGGSAFESSSANVTHSRPAPVRRSAPVRSASTTT